METPARDDDPVDSWEYRDHQCHVYASTDPVGDETVWAGYAQSKLPEGVDTDDLSLHVPGNLASGVEDGWLGFSASGDDRDADRTRRDVEDLVDQLVALESSMDG